MTQMKLNVPIQAKNVYSPIKVKKNKRNKYNHWLVLILVLWHKSGKFLFIHSLYNQIGAPKITDARSNGEEKFSDIGNNQVHLLQSLVLWRKWKSFFLLNSSIVNQFFPKHRKNQPILQIYVENTV